MNIELNPDLVKKIYLTAANKCGSDKAWTFENEYTKAVLEECFKAIDNCPDLKYESTTSYQNGWDSGLLSAKIMIADHFKK